MPLLVAILGLFPHGESLLRYDWPVVGVAELSCAVMLLCGIVAGQMPDARSVSRPAGRVIWPVSADKPGFWPLRY